MQEDKNRGKLKTKFEGFSAAPSAGLWDAIADSLDEKKKRKGIIWWVFGSGIAAVGLISILVFNGFTVNNTTQKEYTNQRNKNINNRFENRINTNNPALFDTDITAKNNTNFTNIYKGNAPNNSNSANSYTNQNKGNLVADNISEKEKKQKQEEKILRSEISSNQEKERKDIVKLALQPAALIATPAMAFNKSTVIQNKNRFSNWEFGFGLSHWRTISNSGVFLDSVSLYDPDGVSENSVVSLQDYNFNKINRPIGVNIDMGYRFSQRFRLVTGLNLEYNSYKIVTSEMLLVADNGTNKTQIRIARIGIPIGVEYDFIKRNRLRVGAGIGILNELPFLERFPNLNSNSASTTSPFQKRFIAGYDFGTNLNLTIGYYLSDKTRIQTNFGLRNYLYQSNTSGINIPRKKAWYGGSIGLIWELGF